MRWTHLVVHHSLTKDGKVPNIQAIRRYHTNNLGWKDVGYHFLIERVNGRCEAFLGRPLTMTGAHTKQQGMNNKAIGVMFTGNFDQEAPDEDLLVYGVRYVVAPMLQTFPIPVERVHMHRDFALYKSCPGKLFPWEHFLSMVRTEMV